MSKSALIKYYAACFITSITVIILSDYLINKGLGIDLLGFKSISGLIIEFIIIDLIPLVIICYFALVLITNESRRNERSMYVSLYFIINFISMLILRNIPAEYMYIDNELNMYNHYGLCVLTGILAVFSLIKEKSIIVEEYSRYRVLFYILNKFASIITSIASCSMIMIYYVIISFIIKYTGLKQ